MINEGAFLDTFKEFSILFHKEKHSIVAIGKTSALENQKANDDSFVVIPIYSYTSSIALEKMVKELDQTEQGVAECHAKNQQMIAKLMPMLDVALAGLYISAICGIVYMIQTIDNIMDQVDQCAAAYSFLITTAMIQESYYDSTHPILTFSSEETHDASCQKSAAIQARHTRYSVRTGTGLQFSEQTTSD